MQLTPLTWNLRGELGYDRGPVALGCASAQGEGVRGAWIEACEHVGGLVAQLHHLPTLVGEVQLRVKRAHCLVWDLGGKTNEYSDRGLWYSALLSWGGFVFIQWKRFMLEASKWLSKLRHLLGLLCWDFISHSWWWEIFQFFYLTLLCTTQSNRKPQSNLKEVSCSTSLCFWLTSFIIKLHNMVKKAIILWLF